MNVLALFGETVFFFFMMLFSLYVFQKVEKSFIFEAGGMKNDRVGFFV